MDFMPAETRDLGEAAEIAAPVSNFSPAAYKTAVDTAKEYIRAGDIFQVVPSQRWTQDFPLPPFALYRSLRRTNPSPFMAKAVDRAMEIGGIRVVLKDGGKSGRYRAS